MSKEQHFISLQEAETMTHAYQEAPEFQGLTIAGCMDKEAYQDLMNQPGCVSVRTYFALDENSILTIVVVGVDANGEDMTSGILLERAQPCPHHCPKNSSLIK